MTTLETALIVVCAVLAVAVIALVFLRAYIIKSVHKPQDIQYTSSMNTEILYGQSNVQLKHVPPFTDPKWELQQNLKVNINENQIFQKPENTNQATEDNSER